MEKEFEVQKFKKLLKSHILPIIYVASSNAAKSFFGKYNLTPSEFLKPFGFSHGLTFDFSNIEKNISIHIN